MQYQDLNLSPKKSVDIKGSRKELALIFVALTVGIALVALLTVPPPSLEQLAILKPGLAIIVSVALAWAWLVVGWRFARAGSPVMSLSPEGVLDRRQLREPIAWASIAAVDMTRVGKNKYVRLTLHGGASPKGGFRLGTRLLGLGGNGLPDNEVCMSVVGLDVDMRTLTAQIITTAALNGHTVAARGAAGHGPVGRAA